LVAILFIIVVVILIDVFSIFVYIKRCASPLPPFAIVDIIFSSTVILFLVLLFVLIVIGILIGINGSEKWKTEENDQVISSWVTIIDLKITTLSQRLS